MILLLSRAGLRYNENSHCPGAQTERRDGAGLVRGLLASKDLTGRFSFLHETLLTTYLNAYMGVLP
jgi:hypothetical protein